jgi:hypothetical protein
VAPPSRTCLPDRSEAEGPAANRQAATKPHPPRPWPSHRKATAPNPCLPTGAKRSGGICSHPSGGNKTPPSTPPAIAQENHCSQLCHPDRSEAKRRDLQSPFIPQQHPHLRRPQPPHRKATTPTFVIPTGAKRSGGICSHSSCRNKTPPSPPLTTAQESYRSNICHPDRSEAERRDLQSPFRPQQNPTFDAPSHRTGKLPLQTFVIPTGAKRSGGICSHPSYRNKTPPSTPPATAQENHCSNLCHPDRSEAERRDLQSPFRPQQKPYLRRPQPPHRKATAPTFVIPTGAEGSAVNLYVLNKAYLRSPLTIVNLRRNSFFGIFSDYPPCFG